MTNGIFIDFDTFNKLSPATRAEIEHAIGMSTGGASSDSDTAIPDAPKLAQLTPSQVQHLMEGITDKPKTVLRTISDYSHIVKLKTIMLAVGLSENDYQWYKVIKMALTKKTRKITSKSQAVLIGYRENYDEAGNYIDTDCWVSDKTYASLKEIVK
jgi:hypothetical protein